jgi:hypothetical protein
VTRPLERQFDAGRPLNPAPQLPISLQIRRLKNPAPPCKSDARQCCVPVAGGGFEQCYNAQAAVAAGSMLVVAVDVVRAPNDKQQIEPMLGKIGALPEELGEVETLLADTGYFSTANVEACEKAGIKPLIARPSTASSTVARTLRDGAARARKSDAGRGDGASAEAARRQVSLCPAQADPGTGVRHHQSGARIPSIFVARTRKSAWRVEPCDHGVEYEADVRPQHRLTKPKRSQKQPKTGSRKVDRDRNNALWMRSSVR